MSSGGTHSIWEAIIERHIDGVSERIRVLRGTPEPNIPHGVFAVCVNGDDDAVKQTLYAAIADSYETYINSLANPNDAYRDPRG
ncbi:MAG: hypothetical protein AAGE85_18720, partial [Pseudomonadota bacterium]